MKQVSHKIISFLMTFVVLFSTMSFTIDTHYCGEVLIDSSMFNAAKSCGMDASQKNSSEVSESEKNCCNNHTSVVNGQKELKVTFNDFTIEQQIFIASFVYSYTNLFENLEYQVVPFKDYKTPLVVKDIQKLDETYLI